MTPNPKPVKVKDPAFKKAMRALPCISCNAAPPSTVSHIKTRGSGGDDAAFNIVPMCGICHAFWESHKMEYLEKYPHVLNLLKALGWKLQGKKLVHPLATY